MTFKAIVAVSISSRSERGFVIGVNNELPWGRDLPADLKHFRDSTLGGIIVMGSKTWESLPKRPLPGRVSIVLTRNRDYEAPGAFIAHSLEEAVSICEKMKSLSNDTWVIGGEQIYRLAMESGLIDEVHLTVVRHAFNGDSFFPFMPVNEWDLISTESHSPDSKNRYQYDFQVYRKTVK